MSINSNLIRLDVSPIRGEALLNRPIDKKRMRYPENRPEFWDITHRMLKRYATANQTGPLNGKETFLKIISGEYLIKNSDDPITQLVFLKLLSEFIFIGSTDCFFRVLKSMYEKYPEIQPYFHKKIVGGITLTPLGIQLILDTHFIQFPITPLFQLPVLDLPSRVELIMDHMPNHFMQGWVTYNPAFQSHFVPVFAHKKDNVTHIYIFDSLGHAFEPLEGGDSGIDALDILIKYFRNKIDHFDKFKIYSYKNRRQFSDAGCSVMAISDLQHLAERHFHGQSLIDFYERQEEKNKPRLVYTKIDPNLHMPIYELTILPPEMQKACQSLTRCTNYIEHPPVDPQAPTVFRYNSSWERIQKKQDLEEFRNAVANSKRYETSARVLNLYLEQKRLQYIVELLTFHFKYLSPTSNALKVNHLGKRKIGREPDERQTKGARI